MGSTFLNDSNVSGLAVRVKWANVEPIDDSFDWSYIDYWKDLAVAQGKKISIRVLAGIGAPTWLLDQLGNDGIYGPFLAKWQNYNSDCHETEDEAYIPQPWDHRFLAEWDELIEKLGQRYNNDSGVWMVVVNGPTASDSEFHLPKDYYDCNTTGLTEMWLQIAAEQSGICD
jgi:hypothetical protein